MSRHRILNWLDSVSPVHDDRKSERPRKRRRLKNEPCSREDSDQIQAGEDTDGLRPPTPLASPCGSAPLAGLSSMPPKQISDHHDPTDDRSPGHDQPSNALADTQSNRTPRTSRRSAVAAALGDDDVFPRASSLPSGSQLSSSKASSKAPKISRNSSPTKQLRNAELDQTGFLRASLRDHQKPKSLQGLVDDLRKIHGGFGILPRDLEKELGPHAPLLPHTRVWNFGDNTTYGVAQLPCTTTVNIIYTLAERCFTNNHPESSWNNDVHSRVLDWILRDRPGKDDLVDYRCCLTAQICPEYQPDHSPPKMVDYCVCIEPERDSPQSRAVEGLCRWLPGQSINHTDWADLTKYPIAVSIETKGPSIGYETALLQEMEFLPGIVVMQHHWWLVATALNEDQKAQTFERVLLGDTESILGIYKLTMALQRLIKWVRDEHWPAFQSSILGL
ncbi:uncharacterized protein BDW47DRAFT_119091 [Aspergillus candidus]|uniref:PD-(D/E)XK nuclease-like domain-containing protein n=1 Tax=Aspergillus candidus TaxID=41067 RepID=A0A2I2F5Z7_ASPCN|nr:hypothetical protein BDW47DRAFT_119091 [Aspergillus candidus]PLB36074.1 hypothetical protein BDW47DRAFT_119091 [Aspergillus candidus]